MASKKAVLGLVTTHVQADDLLEDLRKNGFPRRDISALFPDIDGARGIGYERGSKAPEGIAAGVGAGGFIGGALGLLVGAGALVIPGAGAFVAAGPIMATLSGLALGGTLGGLAGGLIGMGIPEIEACVYEGKVTGGQILLSVHVENDDGSDRAKWLFERHGASYVSNIGERRFHLHPYASV